MKKIMKFTLLSLIIATKLNAERCTRDSDCRPNQSCINGECYTNIEPILVPRNVGSRPVQLVNPRLVPVQRGPGSRPSRPTPQNHTDNNKSESKNKK